MYLHLAYVSISNGPLDFLCSLLVSTSSPWILASFTKTYRIPQVISKWNWPESTAEPGAARAASNSAACIDCLLIKMLSPLTDAITSLTVSTSARSNRKLWNKFARRSIGDRVVFVWVYSITRKWQEINLFPVPKRFRKSYNIKTRYIEVKYLWSVLKHYAPPKSS